MATAAPGPVVIGLAGRIGAGKTTAGKHLEVRHGFQYVRYSQVLADWLGERPGGLQAVGWDVMAGGMQAELNRRLIARIQPKRDCVVDGLRHPIDFDSLQDSFSQRFFLLYIDSPPNIRWEHFQQKSHLRTLGEFESADSHPVEQQIELLRPRAFATLSNTRSVQHFLNEIDTFVNHIRSGDAS